MDIQDVTLSYSVGGISICYVLLPRFILPLNVTTRRSLSADM